MELHNYMETVVKEVLEELLSKRDDLCKCERCRYDMMAMALNNLPPQYYVSEKGEIFTKLFTTYVDTRARVITEVTKAIMKVEKEPHHQQN